MLSERCQSQEITYYIIPFIIYVQNRKIYRDRKYINGCLKQAGMRELKEVVTITKRYRVSLWDDEDYEISCDDGSRTL